MSVFPAKCSELSGELRGKFGANQAAFFKKKKNCLFDLRIKTPRDCVTQLSVQVRALPYKTQLVLYYVMNAKLRLRIRLGFLRISRVEIWTAGLPQTKKNCIKSDTL